MTYRSKPLRIISAIRVSTVDEIITRADLALYDTKKAGGKSCRLFIPVAKPPLRPKHVWAIRTKLQIDHRTCDLALFNLAIDSKLPGCDVAAIKVDDVAPNGSAINRATVRQRKTGRPVRFELTEPARQTIEDYIKAAGKRPGEFLFSGRRPGHSMTTRQYARLLSNWLVGVDLDPHLYSAHSLRRTK